MRTRVRACQKLAMLSYSLTVLTDIGRSRQHAATPYIDRVGGGESEWRTTSRRRGAVRLGGGWVQCLAADATRCFTYRRQE